MIAGTMLFGCSSRTNGPPEGKAGKPAVAVEVFRASSAEMTEGIDVVGSLSPKFQADAKAEFAGIVTQVYVAEWVKVQKGTPLAKLDTRELDLMHQKTEAAAEESKAAVIQAEVAQNRAEREHIRFVKLKEVGLVTKQNLDDAATEKDASAARVSAARAHLRVSENELRQMQTRLSKATIRSPMNGVVSQRNVNVGDLVGDFVGNKVLFHIVDGGMLDLTLTVPSNQMGALRIGQPLTFSTDAIPGKTFTGKVTFINPAVNEADRSVRIIADVSNDSGELKAGLFAKGRIITGKRSGVLQVPRTSLVSWDVMKKQAEVFVVRGEKVNRLAVRTGSVSSDLVEVSSGLTPGDLVVNRGGFNLRDGDRVKVVQGNGR